MKLSALLAFPVLLAALVPAAAHADTIDNYSFSVHITSSGFVSNPYAGHTYTGTFQVDEQTGGVTNFSADLLGGTQTIANLGNVAQFTNGVVSSLHFTLGITAGDGSSHSAGFTSGFSSSQLSNNGLDPNNYFAYLTTSNFFQGGGTPVFTNLTPTAATPEPSSLALLATGALTAAATIRRKLRS